MRSRIRRPSAASIVAILALVVAMSGAAFAALQSGDALIAKRTVSGNRLRLNTVTGKEVVNLVWHPLNLTNGWENYNGTKRAPAWALDAQGIVHLRGAVDQGSVPGLMVFARLPLSVRPSVDLWLTTGLQNAAPGRIDINNGYLIVESPSGDATAEAFTNLDGVTWAR